MTDRLKFRNSRSPEQGRRLPVISSDITAVMAEKLSGSPAHTPKAKTVRFGATRENSHLNTERSRLVEQTLRIRLQQAGHLQQPEADITSVQLHTLSAEKKAQSSVATWLRKTSSEEKPGLVLPPLPRGCKVTNAAEAGYRQRQTLSGLFKKMLGRVSAAPAKPLIPASSPAKAETPTLEEFVGSFPRHLQPAVQELARGIYALTPDEIGDLVQPLDWKTRKLILMTSATRTRSRN